MKVKITKLQTEQNIYEYYFTDLRPNYKIVKASIIDTQVIDIPDETLKMLVLLGNTENSLAANIYYLATNEAKIELLGNLTALSEGY